MQPHFKKYILENADTKSVEEIAAHLKISEKSVADFLKRENSKSSPRGGNPPAAGGGISPAAAPSRSSAADAQPAAVPRRPGFQAPASRDNTFPLRDAALFLFVAAVLAWLIYFPSLAAGFTFDDQETILDNPAIRAFDPGAIWNAFNSRFVVGMTLAMNYAFGGLEPAGYHLFNTAVHVAASFCVFLLAWVTLGTPALRDLAVSRFRALAAWGAGLLFLVHPVQTQPVNYVWQRSAVLAALFYAAALYFYVGWRTTGRRVPLAAAIASSLAAMYSKETSITLPAAVLLYEVFFFQTGRLEAGGALKRVWPFLALFPVIPLTWTRASSLTLDMMRPDTMKGDAATGLDLGRFVSEQVMTRQDYILTQFNVVRTYLRLILVPVRQNLDYDYPVARALTPEVAVSALLTFAILGAAVWLFKRHRLFSFCILWFYLALSVESLVVQADVLFEHRLYLPMAAASIAAAAALVSLLRKPALIAAVLAALVLAYGGAAHARNRVWSDEFVLWQDVVRKSPGKARPHLNLAVAYHEAGNTEKAIEHFREAIRINPGRALTYYNLAASQKKAGDAAGAVQSYEKAIELKPRFAEAYNNLAILRAGEGNVPEAVRLLERALALKPGYEDARVNLEKLSGRRTA